MKTLKSWNMQFIMIRGQFFRIQWWWSNIKFRCKFDPQFISVCGQIHSCKTPWSSEGRRGRRNHGKYKYLSEGIREWNIHWIKFYEQKWCSTVALFVCFSPRNSKSSRLGYIYQLYRQYIGVITPPPWKVL